MEDDIIIKIRENQTLEVLKYISLEYLVFLFFLGLILGYQETVIMACLIFVFAVIVDLLNAGEMVVSEKGISTKNIKFIPYKKIYRINLENRILTLYSRDELKPIRIYIDKKEDKRTVESAYRFITAKVKRLEEDKQEHDEFVKKYLQ